MADEQDDSEKLSVLAQAFTTVIDYYELSHKVGQDLRVRVPPKLRALQTKADAILDKLIQRHLPDNVDLTQFRAAMAESLALRLYDELAPPVEGNTGSGASKEGRLYSAVYALREVRPERHHREDAVRAMHAEFFERLRAGLDLPDYRKTGEVGGWEDKILRKLKEEKEAQKRERFW